MLSKKTKVSVKNKENKTACFIEIEELLNSPELISDLPCLGIEKPEVGLRARRLESGKEASRAVGRICCHLPWLQRHGGLQKGAGSRFPAHRHCQDEEGEFGTLVSECIY